MQSHEDCVTFEHHILTEGEKRGEERAAEEVDRHDQLVGPARQRVGFEIRLDEPERDAGRRRGGTRQHETRRRDVGDRHVEAPAGEPARVPAGPAGEVERAPAPRQEVVEGDEEGRGIAATLRAMVSIAGIPARAVALRHRVRPGAGAGSRRRRDRRGCDGRRGSAGGAGRRSPAAP